MFILRFCQELYVQTAIFLPIVHFHAHLFSLRAACTLTTVAQWYICGSVQGGNISISCGQTAGTHTTLRQHKNQSNSARRMYDTMHWRYENGVGRALVCVYITNKARGCRYIIRATFINISMCLTSTGKKSQNTYVQRSLHLTFFFLLLRRIAVFSMMNNKNTTVAKQ